MSVCEYTVPSSSSSVVEYHRYVLYVEISDTILYLCTRYRRNYFLPDTSGTIGYTLDYNYFLCLIICEKPKCGSMFCVLALSRVQHEYSVQYMVQTVLFLEK